jgi:hypothetical protein
VRGIEARFARAAQSGARAAAGAAAHARSHAAPEVARVLFKTYRQRTLVGLTLMAAQAFFYNAIFFTYALILTNFYGIPADRIGWYILPFAAGNVLGTDPARPFVRHDRPQGHDRIDLCYFGCPSGRHQLSVQPKPPLRAGR